MKKNKMIVREYCLLTIIVCCLLSFIMSNLYIAQNGAHINHKHNGQSECSVCVNIGHADGLLHNIKLISGNYASIPLPAVFVLLSIFLVKSQIFTHTTLVKMKTRFDN